MIVCQTTLYKRRQSEFTSAEHSGGMVAHHDLVRAVLSADAIEGVHFFVGGKTDDDAPIDDLRHNFPGREIAVHPLARLGELSQTHEYVFPIAVESLPMLAGSRLSATSGRFPISGIVHSISSHASAMLYISMLVLAESFDRIVVTSDAGRSAINKVFDGFAEFLGQQLMCNFKVKPPIVKIPFGVDENYLRPLDRPMARARMDLPIDRTILLYVGRITEEYKADLEPLLLAFQQVHAADKKAMLVLAGSDNGSSYVGHLQQMCAGLDLQGSVLFKTNFSFELKPFLYSAADVFVSPVDNVQETFGISILEASACGLPVVASDWSGYRDSVIHGATGFLVPTYWDEDFISLLSVSAPLRNQVKTTHLMAQHTVVEVEALTSYLRLLVADRELRRNMGAKGRERILREYCWPQIISRYLQMWNSQWDELRTQPVQRPLIKLGLNEIYSHFATNPLKHEIVLEANPEREFAGNGKLLTEETERVRQIWSACAAQPSSAKHLAENQAGSAPGALSWLWKKGYLRSRDVAETVQEIFRYRKSAS